MSGPSGAGRRTSAPGTLPSYGIAAPLSPLRILGYALLAVLGLLVGAAGGLVQAGWFPGGLLLALAGAGGLFHGGARLTGTRIGAVAPAVGWMLAVIALTVSRPEGDFIFAAGSASYLFLFGGMLIAAGCIGLARPGSR